MNDYFFLNSQGPQRPLITGPSSPIRTTVPPPGAAEQSRPTRGDFTQLMGRNCPPTQKPSKRVTEKATELLPGPRRKADVSQQRHTAPASGYAMAGHLIGLLRQYNVQAKSADGPAALSRGSRQHCRLMTTPRLSEQASCGGERGGGGVVGGGGHTA